MEMKKLPLGDGQDDGQYEFRDPSRGLIIRGTHPEWVLQAAAEVIGTFSRLAAESLVDELAALHSLGSVRSAELAAARAEKRRRFDIRPRCSVVHGAVEYFWTSGDDPAPKPLTLLPEMRVARTGAGPMPRKPEVLPKRYSQTA